MTGDQIVWVIGIASAAFSLGVLMGLSCTPAPPEQGPEERAYRAGDFIVSEIDTMGRIRRRPRKPWVEHMQPSRPSWHYDDSNTPEEVAKSIIDLSSVVQLSSDKPKPNRP